MENKIITAEEATSFVTDLTITNDDENSNAYDFAKMIAKAEKEIKNKYKGPKAEAQAKHKAIVKEEKEALKPYEDAKKLLKKAIGAYEIEKAKKIEEQQKAMKDVADMFATPIEEPKEFKTHTRKVWKAKVVDAKKIPDDLKQQIVNMYAQAFFDDYAKIYKEHAKADGVEFYTEETVVLR